MVEEPKLSTRLLGKRKAAILNESSHDEESDVDKVMIKKELESSQTTFIADSDDGAYNSDASTVPPSDNGDDKRETRTVKDEPMSSQDTAIQFTPTAPVSIKPKKTILAMSSDEEDC